MKLKGSDDLYQKWVPIALIFATVLYTVVATVLYAAFCIFVAFPAIYRMLSAP